MSERYLVLWHDWKKAEWEGCDAGCEPDPMAFPVLEHYDSLGKAERRARSILHQRLDSFSRITVIKERRHKEWEPWEPAGMRLMTPEGWEGKGWGPVFDEVY